MFLLLWLKVQLCYINWNPGPFWFLEFQLLILVRWNTWYGNWLYIKLIVYLACILCKKSLSHSNHRHSGNARWVHMLQNRTFSEQKLIKARTRFNLEAFPSCIWFLITNMRGREIILSITFWWWCKGKIFILIEILAAVYMFKQQWD